MRHLDLFNTEEARVELTQKPGTVKHKNLSTDTSVTHSSHKTHLSDIAILRLNAIQPTWKEEF